MPFWNKTLSKASGFTTAFVSAIATEHYAPAVEHVAHVGGPMMIVLSHLFTHIGSEYIAPLGEDILERFYKKKPGELNHDIQKALLECMEKAAYGIRILYKEQYPNFPLDRSAKNFIKKFKKEFIDEFSPASGKTLDQNELKSFINKKESDITLFSEVGERMILKQLTLKIERAIQEQRIPASLGNLFSEKFFPLTQFYFSEHLKHSKNTAARHAIEKMFSEETLLGINRLLKLQEKSEAEIRNNRIFGKFGKLSPHKMNQLKSLVKELNNPKKLEIEYNTVLKERFDNIQIQYQAIHKDLSVINANINGIKKILSINMRIASAIVIIAIITSTIIVLRNSNKPFDANIVLIVNENLHVRTDFPSFNVPAKLTLLVPDRIVEAFVSSNSSGNFSQLDHKWLGEKVPLKFEDDFWELAVDSIELNRGRIAVPIRPKKIFGEIEGTVSYITKNKKELPIAGSAVHFIGDTILYTNSKGEFKATLPSKMIRTKYPVKVIATGFKESDELFNPGTYPLPINLIPEN